MPVSLYNKRNVEIKLKDMQNIEIIEAGTWNKEGRLSFNYDGPASRINEVNSTDSIIVTSIDNIVRNELVTYIKMDVEGAELESIIGAQNTIKQNITNGRRGFRLLEYNHQKQFQRRNKHEKEIAERITECGNDRNNCRNCNACYG